MKINFKLLFLKNFYFVLFGVFITHWLSSIFNVEQLAVKSWTGYLILFLFYLVSFLILDLIWKTFIKYKLDNCSWR